MAAKQSPQILWRKYVKAYTGRDLSILHLQDVVAVTGRPLTPEEIDAVQAIVSQVQQANGKRLPSKAEPEPANEQERLLQRRLHYWTRDPESSFGRPGRRAAWAGIYEFPEPTLADLEGDEPEYDPNYQPKWVEL